MPHVDNERHPGLSSPIRINSTGYGGNLDVTVTEADGRKQSFQVPYASVANLLRPGTHNYDFVIGKLNDTSLSSRPLLAQATYQRGLTNMLSGYGGLLLLKDYYSLQLGTAISTVIGAFSADITHASAKFKDIDRHESSGQSISLKYSKFISETDSNLSIAAYRYSTSGYYDLLTASRVIDAEDHGRSASNIWRPKNKFNITMNHEP